MLEDDLKTQLKAYLERLQRPIVLVASVDDGTKSGEMLELLRKVKAAQYVAAHPGEVCPAKWKEGEKTLKPSLDLVGKI